MNALCSVTRGIRSGSGQLEPWDDTMSGPVGENTFQGIIEEGWAKRERKKVAL